MIRIVASICVALVGLFILYLPSVNPPERFLDQLRTEHQHNGEFWGAEHSVRIMSVTLDIHEDATKNGGLLPSQTNINTPVTIDTAVGKEMSQVGVRFFDSQYMKSVETLLLLATYRFVEFKHWLLMLLVFVIAAWFDGGIRRVIKSKEFLQHNPEIFGVNVILVVIALCTTVLAFVVPLTVHPLLLIGIPVSIGVFGSFAIANFHYRG